MAKGKNQKESGAARRSIGAGSYLTAVAMICGALYVSYLQFQHLKNI